MITIETSNGIKLRGKELGSGMRPLICTPLVGKNVAEIRSELDGVLSKQPDIIEWRADFFTEITQIDSVVDSARQIRQAAGDVPIIFTIRSGREGGQPIPLTESEIVQVHKAVCRTKSVDVIDFELSNLQEHLAALRRISWENDTRMIMSYHNFEFTPALDVLQAKFAEAESFAADIAKVAVMSQSLQDVLNLLSATASAKASVKIPLITMSMGEYGSITRLVGGIFGSSVTFGVGQNSSAPGQIPIGDLRTVLDILQGLFGEG